MSNPPSTIPRFMSGQINTEASLWAENVGDLTLPQPLTAKANTSVLECVRQMQQSRASCIVIADDQGQLAGIVTERDIMNNYVETLMPSTTPIQTIMRERPFTLSPEQTIGDAFKTLSEKNIRHLPIIDAQNQVLGILNVQLLVERMAETYPKDLLNRPPEGSSASISKDGG